ncbi:MAG: carbohydrate ABC transporter permease [Chloroflexi bacterium]|nr:carbohydrate ABC transporter permease [Chloroflexota bacterium]MDL1883781.1 carbohydrate ABC transporter permease [Anaerolineae bacterium CFX8]
MSRRFQPSMAAAHGVLILWALVVLLPVWTMLINSVKPKREIFRNPFGLPSEFTLDGYINAWTDGKFDLYFRNSLIVAVVSLVLILLIGSLAAYALASWRSRVSNFLYIYFIAGLMIPIRLGTINLFQIIQALGLSDNLAGLILIYTAMGMPIATFVLTSFIRSVPVELTEAARIDGASEFRIYRTVILPLIRPALATVTIFNVIPIWNDLWFPLIFIRNQEARTVTLGVTLLFGQYQTDWTRALSALSMAAVPVLAAYLLMSGQFIKGLTAGALKG